jgi:hypothetical protein
MAEIELNINSNAKEQSFEFKKLAGAVGVFVTAATAAAATIATLTVNAALNRRELEQMARLAGLNAREFQRLSFATEQYGITGEQLSDISKDVTEKLGEFAAVGSGAFTDFMDITGMSKTAAQALAKELGNMPAPDALLEITRMLEGAGADRSQISFVLESLGSDLTKLIPLLENGGEEINTLGREFDKATKNFAMTPKMTDDLAEFATKFNLLTEQGTQATDFFGATFAPVMESVADTLIKALGSEGAQTVIENVTLAIIDFGIAATMAFETVLPWVERLLDGLNKIGTAISVVVSGIGGFGGALLGGASLDEAADIAAEIEREARDRGVERERAIGELGGISEKGLQDLNSVLVSLKASIEKGNSQQVQTATQVNKATSNNKQARQV